MATTPKQKGISRREFLPKAAGVAAIGAAGVIGYELAPDSGSSKPKPAPAPAPASKPAPVSSSEVRDFRHAAGPPSAGGHDHRGREPVWPAEHAALHLHRAD